MSNHNASLLSYFVGWFSLLFGNLTLSDWATIFGTLATIFGFLVTWYYKHQEFKLKKQQLLGNRHGNTKKDSDNCDL
ncbi:hypothetical protein FPQ14_11675 [Gilliamella apicola]|uniref:Holin n=1 Tax=Gilliamella apicola TaxID=1196095 RepID=A0A556RGH7_9GAMM|nr:HP1 family phage holin [Gilliamella apicola]TSJ87995.1 hypothetical protein FPQ14_11675 [Gilliamella apicola]